MVYRHFPIYISFFLRAPKTNKQSKQTLICMTVPICKKKSQTAEKWVFCREDSFLSAFEEAFYISFFRNACAIRPWHIGCPSPRAGFPCSFILAYEWYQRGRRKVPQALHRRHSELFRDKSLENTFTKTAIHSHLCDKERPFGFYSSVSVNDIIQYVCTEWITGLAIWKYKRKCH